MQYEDGAIAVPTGPGLGVRARPRQARPSTTSSSCGSARYPYDHDPLRPGWTPLVPNERWADPADARVPEVPS